MKFITFTTLIILVFSASYSLSMTTEQSRKEGLEFGSSQNSLSKSSINESNKLNTPGYVTDNPKESQYYDNHAGMKDDALNNYVDTEQGKVMMEDVPNRPEVDISYGDDFLDKSRAIEGNPEEVVNMLTGSYGECNPITHEATEYEVRVCDKYVEPGCVDGSKLVKVKTFSGSTYSYPSLKMTVPHRIVGGCSRYDRKTEIDIIDPSQITKFTLNSVRWDDAIYVKVNGKIVFSYSNPYGRWCEHSRVFYSVPNKNLKPYLIAGKNRVEVILGITGGGLADVRFTLNYNRNKVCQYTDECAKMDSNCKYSSTKCLNKSLEGKCNYEQKIYNCGVTTSKTITDVECGSDIYCVNDQCTQINDSDNEQDFATSISYLQAINESGLDNNNDPDNLTIFNGQSYGCDKDLLSYNNCCSDSGWGQDYLGASCNESEKALIQKQSERLCHHIGSYCSKKEKLTGTCLKTRKVNCCFNSKISRVIIEQGKSQLGIGWGSPQSPNCSGFSPEQMASLRFDEMDLSEISSDIANSVDTPDPSYYEDKVQNYMEDYAN